MVPLVCEVLPPPELQLPSFSPTPRRHVQWVPRKTTTMPATQNVSPYRARRYRARRASCTRNGIAPATAEHGSHRPPSRHPPSSALHFPPPHPHTPSTSHAFPFFLLPSISHTLLLHPSLFVPPSPAIAIFPFFYSTRSGLEIRPDFDTASSAPFRPRPFDSTRNFAKGDTTASLNIHPRASTVYDSPPSASCLSFSLGLSLSPVGSTTPVSTRLV